MHGSVLYVLEGYSSSCDPSEPSERNHVFCIDTSEDAGAGGGWYKCPSMITRRSGAMATFFKGELYVMGGSLPLLGENWAECLNLASKKWSILALPPPPISPPFIACGAKKLFLGSFGVLQVMERYNKLKEVENIPPNFPLQRHGLITNGCILFFYNCSLHSYNLRTRGYTNRIIVGLEGILGYQCEDIPSLIYLNGSITKPVGARFCLVRSDRRPCDRHPLNDCLHVHCTTFHAVYEFWDEYDEYVLVAYAQASESFVIECRQDSTRLCHFKGAMPL
ncbi:Kelch repeat type 1 [Corchorus capsularis]|uniref:Kelch repeat type 1 n=1 Tax=Corchorus capsularis TaxID=210143 RepID=A0A1R3HYF4_COCAP|nr:Kelch repeat type 1 [Corchorus capsularis]